MKIIRHEEDDNRLIREDKHSPLHRDNVELFLTTDNTTSSCIHNIADEKDQLIMNSPPALSGAHSYEA